MEDNIRADVNIPEDVLFSEILARLAVKPLTRFKAVARRWNSIISSSHAFHKQHLTFQPSDKRTLRMIMHKYSPTSSKSLLSMLQSKLVNKELKHGYEEEIIDHRRHSINLNHVEKVIGSCNGLICISFVQSYDDISNQFFMIWNPTTHHKRIIDGPRVDGKDAHVLLYGFAYDLSSDDYKIVCLAFSDSNNKKPFGYLYTLKKQEWRRLDASWLPLDYIYTNHSVNVKVNPVSVDGTLHWLLGSNEKGWSIVAFDLAKESYLVVPLPPLDYTKVALRWLYLCEIRDCLCMIYDLENTIPLRDDNGDGVWDSWKILASYKYSSSFMDLKSNNKGGISVKNDGYFLLINSRGHSQLLLSPRLLDDSSKYVYNDSNYVYNGFHYVESLVSPNSYYSRGQTTNDVMNKLISSMKIKEKE